MRNISKNYGLTLIEIGITILILIILAAILYPVLTRSRHLKKQPTCSSNQRQIMYSIMMYAQDHEELLPESSSIWRDIQVDKPVLICPEAKKTKNGYLYNNNLSGVNIGKIAKPSKKLATVDGKTTLGINRTIENIYYTPSDVLFRHYVKEKNIYFTPASYADGHIEVLTKVTEPPSWDTPVNKEYNRR